MPQYYVYILACSDGTLYTGYTTDPRERLHRHNSGKGSRYTRGRTPVRLAYLERVKKKGDALRREIAIKRMSRSAKLLLCDTHQPEGHSLG